MDRTVQRHHGSVINRGPRTTAFSVDRQRTIDHVVPCVLLISDELWIAQYHRRISRVNAQYTRYATGEPPTTFESCRSFILHFPPRFPYNC